MGDGYRVRCLVRASSDTATLRALGAELAVADLTAGAGLLARALQGCTHVLHCGALVSDWASPREVAAVNVAGTRELLAAAAEAGVRRFVHLSSTDVYGYPGGVAVDESHASTRFRNWYSQTKRAAEAEVQRFAAMRGLDAVILRPATVYGPRSHAVVLEIARAIRGGNMVLIDGGRAVAGLCFIDNLIDAAVLAIGHERASGQALNVTDGIDVTWRRFVDDLADGLDCPRPRWSMPYALAAGLGFTLEHGYRAAHRATRLTTRPLLSRQAVHVMGIDQSFSNARARELLGWEPRVDYVTGLAATLDWLRAQLAE